MQAEDVAGYTQEDLSIDYKEIPLEDIPVIEKVKTFSKMVNNNRLEYRSFTGMVNAIEFHVLSRNYTNLHLTSAWCNDFSLEFVDRVKSSLGERIDADKLNYMKTYSEAINEDEITLITGHNYKEKTLHSLIDILNELFKPFDKKINGEYYSVVIPNEYFEAYDTFIKNRGYYKSLNQDDQFDEAFYLIDHYLRLMLYERTSNFVLENILDYVFKGFDYYLEGNILNIKLTIDGHYTPTKNRAPARYDEREWRLFLSRRLYPLRTSSIAHRVIDFFRVLELMVAYVEVIELEDVSDYKEDFLDWFRTDLIPIDQIKHKTAQAYAKKNNINYLHPLINEDYIPKNLPFSVIVKTTDNNKVDNVWQIIPPSDKYPYIKKYKGNNEEYPQLSSKAEPHVVGEEFFRTEMSESFYEAILNEYDYEHNKVLQDTLNLIDKYPRLANDVVREEES